MGFRQFLSHAGNRSARRRKSRPYVCGIGREFDPETAAPIESEPERDCFPWPALCLIPSYFRTH